MFSSPLFFLKKLNEVYYIRQISSFSAWLVKNSMEDHGVFIDLPHQERFLKGNLTKNHSMNENPSFVLCKPGGIKRALGKLNFGFSDSWYGIFISDEFEIWEDKGRYSDNDLPIRFGLTETEKTEALVHARRVLNGFLKKNENDELVSKKLQGRFLSVADVDVTLWVRGELRGSRIIEGLPLGQAIEDAVVRACRDDRFKPLSGEELNSTIIEIAVLSDLRLPLSMKELKSDYPYAEKGYRMSVRGKSGWFLPAVFNCVTFKGMNDFLAHLIEEKIDVSKIYLPESNVEMFEVDDFIESPQGKPLALNGPLVLTSSSQDIDSFYECADKSADFLCRIQENDGNIPPIINPLTGKTKQIDWVRLALSAWALGLWGEARKCDSYRKAARNSFLYLRENLYSHPYLSEKTRCMALIYYRRLAAVLGEVTEAEKSNESIMSLIHNVDYEPILYSQVAIHLLDVASNANSFLGMAERFAQIVFADFQRKISEHGELELAKYPELIFLFQEIGTRTRNVELSLSAKEINAWFLSKQSEDGGFPSSTNSGFSYTRGTGKIFEVLCLDPVVNALEIEKTIAWIKNMQFSEENTFFIKKNIKEIIMGGFRHDYFKQEVWIDSTAHIVIGAARLKLSTRSDRYR